MCVCVKTELQCIYAEGCRIIRFNSHTKRIKLWIMERITRIRHGEFIFSNKRTVPPLHFSLSLSLSHSRRSNNLQLCYCQRALKTITNYKHTITDILFTKTITIANIDMTFTDHSPERCFTHIFALLDEQNVCRLFELATEENRHGHYISIDERKREREMKIVVVQNDSSQYMRNKWNPPSEVWKRITSSECGKNGRTVNTPCHQFSRRSLIICSNEIAYYSYRLACQKFEKECRARRNLCTCFECQQW